MIKDLSLPCITQTHIAVCCEPMLSIIYEMRESKALNVDNKQICTQGVNLKWAQLNRFDERGCIYWKLAKQDLDFIA